MYMNYKIFSGLLMLALVTGISACNQGPDPAEQMAAEYQQRNPAASPAASDDAADTASEESAAAENPCGDAAAENPCNEAESANPCGEAEEAADENPCAAGDETTEENPCAADDTAEENPCAVADADETATDENPCAADDEAAEENPCAADSSMEEEAEATDEPLMEEESDEPMDPVDSFMELDPRDILRAKQQDLENRLTSPWDEENPDGFIPETGRVDPLTIVNEAVPDELKPPRDGSTDINEIQTYLVTLGATQAVEGVAAALQCHSVIEIGVISTAYFSLGSGEEAPRFAMQEGSSFGINGTQVTCTGVSDTKVSVTISANVPGANVSRSKIYIPRSVN